MFGSEKRWKSQFVLRKRKQKPLLSGIRLGECDHIRGKDESLFPKLIGIRGECMQFTTVNKTEAGTFDTRLLHVDID